MILVLKVVNDQQSSFRGNPLFEGMISLCSTSASVTGCCCCLYSSSWLRVFSPFFSLVPDRKRRVRVTVTLRHWCRRGWRRLGFASVNACRGSTAFRPWSLAPLGNPCPSRQNRRAKQNYTLRNNRPKLSLKRRRREKAATKHCWSDACSVVYRLVPRCPYSCFCTALLELLFSNRIAFLAWQPLREIERERERL